MVLFLFPSTLSSLFFLQVANFFVFLFILSMFLFSKIHRLVYHLFLFSYTKWGVCTLLFPLFCIPCTSLHIGLYMASSFFFFFLFCYNSFVVFCCVCSATTLLCLDILGSFQHFEVINNAATNVHVYFHIVKIYLHSKFLWDCWCEGSINSSFISCCQVRDMPCSGYLLLLNRVTVLLLYF